MFQSIARGADTPTEEIPAALPRGDVPRCGGVGIGGFREQPAHPVTGVQRTASRWRPV